MERYLRKATIADAKLLFDWANDDETRKNSFSTEKIKWEDHIKWLEKKLQDESSHIYIFMDFFKPLGMVRIDEEDNSGVISYSVDPSVRGQGIGSEMLSFAEKKYRKIKGDDYKLVAEVKNDNAASNKIFKKLGYKEECKEEKIVYTRSLSSEKTTIPKKQRDEGLEVLRCIAMMMVILLHYLQKGGLLASPVDDMSGSNLLFWLIECLAISCVNVYVLISGYYMVETRFTLSRIIRTWGQVFFYSVGITVVMLILGLVKLGDISDIYNLYYLICPITGNHYWFATGYVFMLLFAPIIASGIKRLGKKQLFTLIMLLLSVFCFLKTILPFELQYDDQGYGIVWFLILFTVAGYIRLHGQEMIKTARAGAGVYLLSSIGIWLYVMAMAILVRKIGKYDHLVSQATDYNFVLVLISSIGLFFAFKNMTIKKSIIAEFFVRIAPYTFGVYLIHEHILVAHKWEIWLKVGKVYEDFRPAHMLGTVILIFAVGILVDIFRSLIFAGISKLANLCLIIYYAKKEIWDYLIFGFLATVVNWVAYAIASRIYIPFFIAGDDFLVQSTSNVVAWVVAVAFAYWTNRCFVFKSETSGATAIIKEFAAFVGARLFSFGVEQVLFMLTIKFIGMNDLVAKFLIGFVVIVLNYFFSKLFIFKKKN